MDKNNPGASTEAQSQEAADLHPTGASRRTFVIGAAAMGLGAGVGLTACGGGSGSDEAEERFGYGVASGDPLSDRVIIWTRVNVDAPAVVQWQVASDPAFATIVRTGTATADATRDFTIKVDVTGLQPATVYHYRFLHGDQVSPIGRTKTLPVGSPQLVRLAVFSCAAYSIGQFHAYADAVRRGGFDAALMLGDYIYETGLTTAEQTAAGLIGREADPRHELHSLSDYRQRYARYHIDADLRALRATMPLIAVWDDHEIINDLWKDGAGGHDATEGSFTERRAAAVRAFHEWLPTREQADPLKIYRSFDFGNLLALHMLDTRLIGRDAPINRDQFLAGAGNAPDRQLLGAEQAAWLAARMQGSAATWQVLGQQVLMGRMLIPLSIFDDFSEGKINDFLEAQNTPDAQLTAEQRALLAQPRIGYELTNWDGFTAAREQVLSTARSLDKNLVVLSGDSHNAWANNLKDAAGQAVGVEFGAPSVTSTGLEVSHLNVGRQLMADAFVHMIPDLKYAETSHRGYLIVTLTPAAATGDFVFVSSVLDNSFSTFASPTFKVLPGSANRTLVPG